MQNRLTKILGIQFPLILGPMRMITLGAMAAAVSNSGGLGQIASSTLPVMQLRDEIKKAKDLTDRPFGINIPLHWPNALDVLDIAMETDVRVITTSGGNPARIMNQAKAGGIQVLHKVSTVEMSLKAQGAGVSGVIGMGFEAGGARRQEPGDHPLPDPPVNRCLGYSRDCRRGDHGLPGISGRLGTGR